ncbi:MAG TPA: hypothetical protein VF796_10310 [Humisphaera sp.]
MSPVTALWSRIVVPDDPTLSPEVAKYFLTLGFTDQERERYQELAAKEQRDLTPSERNELEALAHASTVIMLLQSKARLSLKRRQPAA